MSRDPIPTYCFALVVVKRGRRFLLVHEQKHGQGWYLPAGRVEPGETFEAAALRETKEEASIEIDLEGILRLEQTPLGDQQRIRVFFLASPRDDTSPKSIPDEYSLEARWFSLDEVVAGMSDGSLRLRGDEVQQWIREVLDGAPLAPLSLMRREMF